MTSRERVITALELKEPDRLPTFEWKISPHLIDRFVPGGEEVDFTKKLGLDGVCCSPVYRKVKVINNDTFIDEFGITRKIMGGDRYPVATGHPVQSLELFRRYEPPPVSSPERFKKIEKVIEKAGKDVAVIVNLHDVFSLPRDLMGLDNFLMAFITDPKLVNTIIGFSVDYNLELAREVKKRGIEIIGIGDDFADKRGPFVSPEMFKKYVYPEFKRVVQGYKKMGFYVIKHSDGNLNPILDMLVDSGIDCLDPIDPLGGMDIGYIKQKYGDRIALKGNVDCVRVLTEGTPEEVETAVKECIKKGAPGGGHIISTSNSLHSGVRPELYEVMLDTIKKYGEYPIKIS